MKKKTLRLISMLLVLVMAIGLCACGGGNPVSSEAESTADAAEDTGKGLKICIVTTSGVDDGSFNENCYDGIKNFIADHPDCTVKDVKEPDLSKVIETVSGLVGDYDVMVLPGFNFARILDIATSNPEKHFILIDSKVQDAEGAEVDAPANVYTMTFKEEEGGFFAGLAAALSSQTGKVAVVNGIAFPSNVNYEFGFMAGVNYANAKLGTNVEYVEIPSYAGEAAVPVEAGGIGTNVGGNYIGDFADQAKGKEVAEALIAAGVDIIFPAAGTAGNGCFTAIKENGSGYCIGCDVDQFDDGVNGSSNIILTSVLKIMDTGITKELNAIYDGTFQGRDDLLGASTDPVGTGFVTTEGRHQLSADAVEKMNQTAEELKAGNIVPPSNFNGYTPTDFPGLK